MTNFRLHRIFDREDEHKRKKQANLEKLRRERGPRNELTSRAEQGADGEADRRMVRVHTYTDCSYIYLGVGPALLSACLPSPQKPRYLQCD